MHYLKPTFSFILAAATLASAQHTDAITTTSADNAVNTKCAAENSVKQCVQSMKPNLENCASDDITCQCTNSANVVDCYNDCPDDPARAGAQFIHQQNCGNTREDTPTSTIATVSTSSISTSAVSSGTATTSKAATTDSSDDNDSDSDDDSGFKEGYPTKSFSGLESNNEASQSVKEGVASGLRTLAARSWISLLGLGLGIIL